MRVAHLIKTNSGAKWAFLLIRELQNLGVDNFVILPASQPGNMSQLYLQEGIKVFDLDVDILFKNLLTLPKRLKLLRKIFDELKPDIVNAWFFSCMLMLRVATGRRPTFVRIFTVPGPLHMEFPITHLVDKLTLGKMDFVVTTSEYTKALYLNTFPRISSFKVKKIYVPVDTGKFTGVRKQKLRRELSISADVPLVGMVAYMYPPKYILGHLRGIKGHETFIDAIPFVHRVFPQARFVIIGGEWRGKGKYFQRLVKRAEDRGLKDILYFTGHRDDVPEIYPDLNIAVHPSLISEDLGGAKESLLAGVPTIASDVGGLPEAVLDGITGLIFPRGKPKELAQRIIWMLQNKEKAKEMALKGQERIKMMHNPVELAKQTLAFYEYCLKIASRHF
jgi:glycosyltransferase involved in cell wall biosynthesis